MNENNSDAVVAIRDALVEVKNDKPGDRSEQDRYYAIVITDLEKILAFAEKYLV